MPKIKLIRNTMKITMYAKKCKSFIKSFTLKAFKPLNTIIASTLCLSMVHANDIKELNFAVIPVAGSSSMETMWKPVAEYLQEDLGIKINLKFVGDYAGVIAGMQYKHVDIAYFGPESYVQAATRAKAEAIVAELNEDGVAGYHGIIITKKDKNLTTLESLKGKTWAFTDPNSTSGTLLPNTYFKQQGIDAQKYFSQVIYSGGHEASILSVKAGRLDAAATNDLDFKKGLGKGWKEEDFNIIWKSDLIISGPIAVRSELPQDLKEKIRQSLLKLNDNKKILQMSKLTGFVSAKDSDYNSIRKLIEEKGK